MHALRAPLMRPHVAEKECQCGHMWLAQLMFASVHSLSSVTAACYVIGIDETLLEHPLDLCYSKRYKTAMQTPVDARERAAR